MKTVFMGLLASMSALAAFGGFAAEVTAPAAPASPSATSAPVIRYVEFDASVNPISKEWIIQAIDLADRNGEMLVLIRLDTPGGLVTSLQEIIKRMLSAKTPIAAWVGPSGAHAASAGFLILIASDVTAMAPGTRTGAASVITPSGEGEKENTGLKKANNDFAALARTIAAHRKRDVDACEKAVVDATVYTDQEALKNGIVGLVARDRDDLLRQLDGREVRRFDGSTTILRTNGAQIVSAAASYREKILGWLAEPVISYFLLMLGIAALYMEFNNPGLIVPGAIGALCLLLFAFSVSLLPVSAVGVALILIAIFLFVLEIKIASYGLLTIGGLLCLVIGSLMLYDGPIPDLRLSLAVVLPTSLVVAGACALALRLSVQAHRTKIATGVEGIVGETGEVTIALAPAGKIFVHGETWDAVTAAGTHLARGTRARVVRVDGARLVVEPADAPPAPGTQTTA
jgi:membrane-bound serine protease (ClpP class)